MKPGEKFELECFDFLKRLYTSDDVDFVKQNTSDSTSSDIAVLIQGNPEFFVEAKDTNAQSGQFVLIPDYDKNQFIFSKRNKSQPNAITDIIIDYMNNDFNRFENAGTAGETIDINPIIFSNWIIDYYKKKNVKYVITTYCEDFVILPINKFNEYFVISAKFRIKKSGSNDPAKKNHNKIINELTSNYNIENPTIEDKKLYVEGNPSLSKTYFTMEGNEYYFSPTDSTGIFKIKHLSKTRNKNVIFSISVKKEQDLSDLKTFENEFK